MILNGMTDKETRRKLKAMGLDPDNYEDPEDFINSESYKPPSVDELDEKIKSEVKNFSKLLDGLSSTEERKKLLWKQIYENALTDRRNAFVLFGDLYTIVENDAANHAVHGQTLTKYMERMSKANDQLIKLAELVSDAVDQQIEEDWNEDSIYEKFQESDNKNKVQ